MNDKQIAEAFGKITAKDSKKEQAYYEILRKTKDKNFMSKKRFTLKKHIFDRYVPLVAACCILICCFSFFAVSGGWFTGESFRSAGDIYSDNGVTAAPTSIDPVWGAEVTVSGNQDEEGSTAAVTEAADETTAGKSGDTAGSAATVDLTATLPMDVGFTCYNISGVPQDAVSLWNELLRIEAVPNSISLDSYDFDGTTLTLDFGEFLQAAVTSAGNSYWPQGIAKTFSSLYPDAEKIVILSGGKSLSLNNNEIDIDALINEDVPITDSKNLVYGE